MSTLYPAVSGRMTVPLAVNRMLFQVHADQSAIMDLQLQLSTGRRFLTPSQAPSSAIKVLAAQRQQEFRAQTEVNLKSAEGILVASETSLAQAQSILNEMRSVALEAASNTISPDQRSMLVHQVETSLSRLVELANTKFADQFIFAGSDVRNAPLQQVGNTVQFTANPSELRTIVDYATTLAANVTANDAFGVQSSQIVGTVDLNPSLRLDTPLAHLNRGTGVRLGAIRLGSGSDTFEVDLSQAYSVGDVLQRISSVSLGGRQVAVSLSTNGINLEYADGLGGMLNVDEVGNGVTAAQLGISNAGLPSSSPVIGSDLDPILAPTTRLSQLLGGTGIAPGSTLRIRQGGTDYVVNTNGLQTVEDLLNRLERTGARIHATIDASGRYLKVQSYESGTELSIGENGDNLATLLGLRSMTLNTPVASLNSGTGIGIYDQGADLILTRNDGSQFEVDLSGVQSIGDMLNRINNHVDNFNPSTRIVASLATVGNGIVLTSADGPQPIAVTNAGGSAAANGLGWTSSGQISAQGSPQGADSVIAGRDVATVEAEGMFHSLIRLKQAIGGEDHEAIQVVWQLLDQDLERLAIARGLVGARAQSISRALDRSAEQMIQLKQTESDNLDADMAEVIAGLTARQTALQASLQLMGQAARMTLFDYL